MPSREAALRYMSGDLTIGEHLKQMSDDVMQDTFYNDIQTRTCYLYDIYHDNRPNSCNGIDGYSDEDCTKKPVDCKFIVKSYKSVANDDPEYHIEFTPEDWNSQSCIPDWYNAEDSIINYKELGVRFPIGLYIDIPDDRGVYNRWLIVYDEIGNQFVKCGVLRCNQKLQWVTNRRDTRYIREQWCVEKTQNSYNSGVYSYNKFTVEENQGKIWLPWNYISAELYYNQRLILSMPIAEPLTWQISKIENTIPRGIQYITLYQDKFNQHTDKVWYPNDADNPLPGQYTMLANYYSAPDTPVIEDNTPVESEISMELKCGSTQIYVGGNKIITADCGDVSADLTYVWSFEIDGEDASTLIKQTALDQPNKLKITFVGDEEYGSKELVIKCVGTDGDGNTAEDTLNIGIIV